MKILKNDRVCKLAFGISNQFGCVTFRPTAGEDVYLKYFIKFETFIKRFVLFTWNRYG